MMTCVNLCTIWVNLISEEKKHSVSSVSRQIGFLLVL
jgi:hypothetical protein